MNITSQFFITYYTGSQDLDLMAMPVSFAGNIGKISEYTRFIEAISSIYAAQSFGVNAAIAGAPAVIAAATAPLPPFTAAL